MFVLARRGGCTHTLLLDISALVCHCRIWRAEFPCLVARLGLVSTRYWAGFPLVGYKQSVCVVYSVK